MIAITVAFLLTMLWYLVDNRTNKKRREHSSSQRITDVIQHNTDNQKCLDGVIQQAPSGRLYYSTPGKTYTGFIRDGRVLNTGKAWPYPPNKP